MRVLSICLVLALAGCAWTDHHWDAPANATSDEVQKTDLHNCQEDAFQVWRSNHNSAGEVLAIGAGGVVGGAIGGAAVGAAVGSDGSLADFTKVYAQKCMRDKGHAHYIYSE